MSFYDAASSSIIFRNIKVGDDLNGATGGDGIITDFDTTGGTNMGELTNVTSNDDTRHTVATGVSPYFDMGLTDDNIIVIVYFNESESRLELVYSTTTDGGTTAQALTGNDPDNPVYFSTPAVISSKFIGSYVSIAVENVTAAADPIHIAAHDSSGADLTYIRLDSYESDRDTSGEIIEVTVDANLSVGIWTDIAVNDSGTPYIGYYNNSQTGTKDSVKVAWFLGDSSTATDGFDYTTDEVTGTWEFMTIPANDQPAGGIVQFKRVNIGFDSSDDPVVGYLANDIEYARFLPEL